MMNTFSFMNIQGLCPQTKPSSIPYIRDILNTENHLFLGLTETWLADSHKKAELEINGYKLYRKDRVRTKSHWGRYSGGVALYIREDIAPFFKPVLEFSNGVNEALMLYSKEYNLILCIIYRQPTNVKHKSDAPEFMELINSVQSKIEAIEGCTPDLYISGDFNIPHTHSISNDSYEPANSCNKQLLNILTDFMFHFNLNQIIHKPTHSNGNILDFLLTNNTDSIFNYKSTPTIHSDHFIIDVTTHLSFNTQKKHMNEKNLNSKFDLYNFHSDKIDWEYLEKELANVRWQKVLEPHQTDPDNQYKIFINKCLNVIEDKVPLKKSKKTHKAIPRDRRILMRKRRKVTKKFQNNRTKQKLINIELELQNSYNRERESNEIEATSKIKKNPKYFYSYAKRFSKTKPKVGPLMDPVKNIITDDSYEMANLLQDQYKSVFVTPKPDYSFLDHCKSQDCTNWLEVIDFSEVDFIEEINTLSSNAAAGPDGFPAIFLKKCKFSLAKPLEIIWRNNFEKGYTPMILKSSFVTPIFKEGDQGLPANYRPVALTSHVTKIFEKILRKKLQVHLESNNLYNESQHGFRTGRSCLSQLLAHMERLISFIENNENVDVIYLDFSKAFDRVDHKILLHKLEKNGIKGKILTWIKSFLTGRYQRVSVNSVLSYETEVTSGVPQGSVLGPLLFLIMIHDIDKDVIHSALSSFADDTRIMKGVSNIADIRKLQADLNAIYKWTTCNNMQLNGLKFEQLKYGKNDDLKKQSIYLTDTGLNISEKKSVKDLGVILNTDMSYKQHIDSQVQKVKNISSWIYRTFKTRDKTVMITLWKSLAIPHLDYCSQLWAPSKRYLMQELESLQKSFFNGLSSIRHLNYWEKLKELNIYSLERRRERYRIIYTWCILEGIVPNFNYTQGKGGIYSYINQRLGRKCHLKSFNHGHKTIWKDSLSEEGPRLFNSLPKYLRNICNCSKDTFKKELDHFLQSLPDEPLLPNLYHLRRADSNKITEMIKHRTQRVG